MICDSITLDLTRLFIEVWNKSNFMLIHNVADDQILKVIETALFLLMISMPGCIPQKPKLSFVVETIRTRLARMKDRLVIDIKEMKNPASLESHERNSLVF